MTFKCESCDRAFAKKSKLNRHVRETHMNIKQYICDECGKNFKRNSHLKRHLISHSENPKPHKCSYEGCYMAFTCKHHLERHIKIIHIEEYQYKCTECDAKFPKKVSLNKHLTYDHGKKKPLTCQLCHKTFFKLGQLEYHHCEEKFKQLNLELIENVGNNSTNMHDINANNINQNANSGNHSNENTNNQNLGTFHSGLVNDNNNSDYHMHNHHQMGHHMSMLHDDQHEPINVPVIDISQYSRKSRMRNNFNYNSEYSSSALMNNNNNNSDMTPELGGNRSRNDSFNKNMNMNSTNNENNQSTQQNHGANNNSNMNNNTLISLENQIQPPIKKKFKPVYQENKNFSLSGEQQPINNNQNKQEKLQIDSKQEEFKQLDDNQKQEEVKPINKVVTVDQSMKGQKIIKISFDGSCSQNEVQQQQFLKEKNFSFSNPSTASGINSSSLSSAGLIMPEGNLQETINEQSKILDAYSKSSVKVEEQSASSAIRAQIDQQKVENKSEQKDSTQQQQQQQVQDYYQMQQQENQNLINNQDSHSNHVPHYMQDPKQEYDMINLDMSHVDLQSQFAQIQGIHNLSSNGLYLGINPEYHYKSPIIKPAGRKLSEIFNPEFMNKERKNSFNSDYGNITIFKEFFLENSFNSRRPSMNINETKNNRKGSIFQLQKLEEDGIIVDLDMNQHDLSGLMQPTQSQEIHQQLQNNYDNQNNNIMSNNQTNIINNNDNNYHQQVVDGLQMTGDNNSQQFIHNSSILQQINQNKNQNQEQSHQIGEQNKQQNHSQQRQNRQAQHQNSSKLVQKQGYTSNNPQLHHHIYQQREVSPQMQYNLDSAKVGYTHSPYIPLVVRSKSPNDSKKKEEKCYKCNYADCDKFYTKLSNLKTHIRTFHFKSKDFKCNYQGCKSAYLHKKSLKEHIARVHKPGGGGAYMPESKRNSEDYEFSDEQHMNQMNQGSLKDIIPKVHYDEHQQQQQQIMQQQQQQQQYNPQIQNHSHHITHQHHPGLVHQNSNDLLVNQNGMYGVYLQSSQPLQTTAPPAINYHQQFTQQQKQQQQQQQQQQQHQTQQSIIQHNNTFQPQQQQQQPQNPFYNYSSHVHQNEYSIQSDSQLQIPLLQNTQSQQSYQSNMNYPQLHRNISLPSHHSQSSKSSVFMA